MARMVRNFSYKTYVLSTFQNSSKKEFKQLPQIAKIRHKRNLSGMVYLARHSPTVLY
jgi:hypothetical protein